MGAGLIVKLFRRAARIQQKRMTLTVAAIAWGTIAIVLLLSFGEGLKRSLQAGQHGLGEGIVIVWMGETSKPFSGLAQGRPIRLRPEDVDLLTASVPEVSGACGEMTSWQTPMTRGRTTLNKRVTGTSPLYGELRVHYAQPGGRFIDGRDMVEKRRVVFLGDQLKHELFGESEAVGQAVLIDQAPFTVIGVMQPKKQMGMYGGPDADHAIIPLTTFEAFFGRQKLTNLVFKPARPELTAVAKRRFMEVMGEEYRFDPTDERALGLWDTMKGQRTMSAITTGIELFLGIIGGLTLLIGGVGVADIMYAVVKHRTREIGVQMALGAGRSTIIGPLVLESLFLTSLGGAIGIGIGFSVVQVLAWVHGKVTSEALDFLGSPTFSLPIALTTVALLGTIGLLAGYFPARRAVAIQPAAALRYE